MGGGWGVTQVVGGMGGIGKTQLAVEFCYRYGYCFTGVHWLQANQDIAGEIAACGFEMELPYWPSAQPEQVEVTLRSWRQSSQRLLVMDNLESTETLGEWLPRLGDACVLLTSRRQDWPPGLGVQVQRMGVLTGEESRNLLVKLAPRLEFLDQTELGKAAEKLGNLPLALDLAGRYLALREALQLGEYLKKIDQAGGALQMDHLESWLGPNPTRHARNLAATFELSWRELDGEAEDLKAARQIFLACGYCAANTPIPREILKEGIIQDELFLDLGLQRLYTLGLLNKEPQGPTMHPLLEEFARLQDKNADESILTSVVDILIQLGNQANNSSLPDHFKPLYPHLQAVARHSEKASLKEDTGSLFNNLGFYLDSIAEYAEAKPYYEQALAIRREVLGEKHPDTARSLNNLGALLDKMGDYSGAKPYYEQALAIRRDVLGEKHPDTARSLNNLGYLLKVMGDYAGAKSYYEQSLYNNRELLGEKHPDTATSLNNLGALLDSMGDYAGAKPYYEQALAIRREVLGEKHPDTAFSLNNLGYLLQAMGDYVGAKPYYEQALYIIREVLGEKHPYTARSLNNLGALLRAMGDYAGAKPYYEQALAIRREVLGEKHPDTAFSLNNLGYLLLAMGDTAGAKPFFEQALQIFEEKLPAGHPNIRLVKDNLERLGEE